MDRQEAILNHMGMAIRLAHKRAMKHRSLDRDEMIGEALLALVEAAAVLDPTKGGTGSRWLQTRINGAMVDRIRRDNPWTRRWRDWRPEETYPVLSQQADHDVYDLDEEGGLPGCPAEEQVEAYINLKRIMSALDNIHPRHRDVYQRYYFEDCNIRDISTSMGISDMRVSQMLAKARNKINAQINR